MATTAERAVVDQAAAGRKRNRKGAAKNGENSGGDSAEHEIHIVTERERRKRMRNMFTALHSLLPHLPPKADKSTIVDEAVKYIKDLEETVESLEKQRQEKLQQGESSEPSAITSPAEAVESREAFLAIQGPASMRSISVVEDQNSGQVFSSCFQTWLSPNVVMNMCGNEAQMSVCSVKKAGLLASMVYILQKHRLEVLSAHVSSDHIRCIYMFHVHAGEACGKHREGFSVEDLFKLAAGEMNLWLLSY